MPRPTQPNYIGDNFVSFVYKEDDIRIIETHYENGCSQALVKHKECFVCSNIGMSFKNFVN